MIKILDMDTMEERNVTYHEWAKQRPELAKLGNALWNAETEEDVTQAFDNIII